MSYLRSRRTPIAEDGVVVVNVRVPDEGHIDGIDASFPFDTIDECDALPADRSTPIAVYCQSGNMSAAASEDLVEIGYTNVVDLAGGMDAWAAAGRPIEES
jgi:phage shock protein E